MTAATSHYSYNAAGDITESIDNAGNVIKYEYDRCYLGNIAGSIISITGGISFCIGSRKQVIVSVITVSRGIPAGNL